MIVIKNLSKSFFKDGREIKVFDNLSFIINKGEFVSIVGPSGCGKSTLLRIIAGLDRNFKGMIKKDFLKTAVVFQDSALLPFRTAKQNILLPFEIKNNNLQIKDKDKKLIEMLKILELDKVKDNYPYELSGGQKQRVAIGGALIQDPEFIIMDEPFSGLDEITRFKLNELLAKIFYKKNVTIIFITHSISEAVYLSDRIIIMSKNSNKKLKEVDIYLPRPRYIDLKDTNKYNSIVGEIRKCLQD